MSKEDITRQEWIGKEVTIIKSGNTTLKGLCGRITDETKNTFTLRTEKRDKKVMKDVCVFQVEHNNKIYIIDGKELVKRSEDRIKGK